MLMKEKSALRKDYKEIRRFSSPAAKDEADKLIFTKLINSESYINAKTVLIYVSVDSEVDTYRIINHALANNKTVAVPFCRGKSMEFYKIKSVDDLTMGDFNIPTVNPEETVIITPDKTTLCIVPALAFDESGVRLGYGGGYYDRYLSSSDCSTVGLTYSKCTVTKLPSEKHDIRVDYIINEIRILSLKQGGFTYE